MGTQQRDLTMVVTRHGLGFDLELFTPDGVRIHRFGTAEPWSIQSSLAMLGFHTMQPLPDDSWKAPYVVAHITDDAEELEK